MTLFKSTNGGINWETKHVADDKGNGFAVAINPYNTNIIYIGGYCEDSSGNKRGRLYKTLNGGSDWIKIGENITEIIYDIAVEPVLTEGIFVATSDRIYRSLDSGSTWEKTSSFGVKCIKINPSSPNEIFAGGESGVIYSNDGGKNWIEINRGLSIIDTKCLDIDSLNSYLYAGSSGGSVYKIDTELLVKPNAPKNLKARARSSSQIKLMWKDKSRNECGFKIERKKGAIGSWTEIAETKANVKAYLDKGLEDNTLYKYRVRAFNLFGASPYSNTAKAKTKKQ